MKQELQKILDTTRSSIDNVNSLDQLENIRVSVLGKKGELTAILKAMGKLSAEERPVMGKLANDVREELESLISIKYTELKTKLAAEQIKHETIDVTAPARHIDVGFRHPLNKVMEEIIDMFVGMGFSVAEGPEIEKDYYNFEALNIPKEHPSRDLQDTFYISDNVVLRTQTSPVQIRVMENRRPPIRIVSVGRVFRSDEVDATHSPVFHQIEGLVVDKGVTMADLKGCLEQVVKGIYGSNAAIRFRPHHFPFTEPSAEVDLQCFVCGGKGCRVCKNEGFIEILGCGMVHKKVLEGCGIDPMEYSGFAFGIGLERIVMGRFGIDDMRLLYENDARFLSQF